MSQWQRKARLYSFVRGLPLLKKILEAETKNLARLQEFIGREVTHHLDIGTGTGDTLHLFRARRRLVCLDASSAMLRHVRAQMKVVARAEALPFANAMFDVVSAIGVLEYVKEETRFLAEVGRVLQAQGHLLFTTAPRMPANYLRALWGERLYLRNAEDVRAALSAPCWQIVAHERTFLQEQWLVIRL